MAGSMRCHYCEQEVRDVWDYQRDHFPRPKAKGGKATVFVAGTLLGRKLLAGRGNQASAA